MSAEPVNDEGDGPANLAQQPGDEEIEVLGREIVVEDVEQQPQAATLRRDAEGRDDREPVAPIVALEDRRLASRSPRLANRGLEHEARFIRENNSPTITKRGFISGATLVSATLESPSRLARGPAAPASATSSSTAARLTPDSAATWDWFFPDFTNGMAFSLRVSRNSRCLLSDRRGIADAQSQNFQKLFRTSLGP